jgi:hypothetical protein
MEQKIVGVVHVHVDSATYSEGARVGGEAHARSKGIAFSYSMSTQPDLDKSDNCVTLEMSMAYGLPNWGYTIWLVG